MHRKAKRLAPEIEQIISESIEKQRKTEIKEHPGIDECADATAAALGRLFALGTQDDDGALERLGYLVGRLVYIMDAVDDLEKDLKSGSFNPFASEYRDIGNPAVRAKFADEAQSLLNLTHYSITQACEGLNLKRFESIAENVLYDGLAAASARLVEKYRDNKTKTNSFTVE
jgi:hypothetical protein